MSHDDLDIVQLLIETGVLSEEDARTLQNVQSETILELMVSKRAIAEADVEGARRALNDMGGSNRTRRLKAHMSMVSIITGNLQRRMEGAGDRLRTQRERITGLTFPVVALAKPEEG